MLSVFAAVGMLVLGAALAATVLTEATLHPAP